MLILSSTSPVRAYGVSTGDEGPDTWRSRGLCAEMDPELFFPEGKLPAAVAQAEEAKAVCAACPVLAQCREFELTVVGGRLRNEYGVFAAMTPDERRTELRRRASGPPCWWCGGGGVSPRRLVVAGVLRRRPCGSALPEPSPEQVYEGRLPAAHRDRPAVGVNFLDVREATPAPSYAPAPVAPVQDWVPWCDECGLEPLSAHIQDGAEYLARVHDAVHHGGAWTARVVRVDSLVSAPSGGVR